MANAKKKINRSSSSDHQKWQVIFNALKQMLRKQAEQLDSLLDQRAFLQERMQRLLQRWNSDVIMFQDMISQTQRQLSLSEVARLVEISRADFLVAAKERNALFNKLKFEHAQSELDDFKAWFDILSHRCPDKEDMNISFDGLYESLKAKVGNPNLSKERSKSHSELQKEVAMLKHDYENLSVKHKSDLTSLQKENTFVWNQYKAMEASYTNQLQTKNDEIKQANEKIRSLLTNMEQLQSAGIEKDGTVTTLRANIIKLEAVANNKDEEISKLKNELELLKSEITDFTSERSTSGMKRKRQSSVLEEKATSAQLQATICALREKISELEAEANQKSEEISTLSKKIKWPRSKNSADMPVLRRCSNEQSSSRSSGRGNGRLQGTTSEEEAACFTQPQGTTATLRSKNSKLEAEADQRNGEIFSLSKELDLLRSTSPVDASASRRCSVRLSSSRSSGRENVKDETNSVGLVSKQGVQRSKRKQDKIVDVEDTPRLFTSQFKIPKLRTKSPRRR
ncbi:unnamed protein product [Amaranthus hypochondriacus]